MKRQVLRISAGLAGVAALGCFPALAADSLPGGASSLREVYDNWVLNCAVQTSDSGKSVGCVVSIEQMNSQTNKRVLALAVSPGADGGVKGSVVMPFGLDLQKGIALAIDQAEASATLAYKTCTPQGCLVPVDWNADSVNALRAGETLKVSAVTDPGENLELKLPLKGFGPALDRAVTLTK